jgi:hypothetical protein
VVVVHLSLDKLDAFSSSPSMDTLRFGIFASLGFCPLSVQDTSVLVRQFFEPFFRARSNLLLTSEKEPDPVFFSVFP